MVRMMILSGSYKPIKQVLWFFTPIIMVLQMGCGSTDGSGNPADPAPNGSISISEPNDHNAFFTNSVILFSGSAMDDDNQDVSSKLTWYSDLDGVLGTGRQIQAQLTLGTHTITAAMLEGSQVVSQKAMTVYIGQEPVNAFFIATDGNDTNDGRSKANAWATFQHAWTVLQPGDTLVVTDGTYNETLEPTISGTALSPITIIAENRGKAIIQKIEDGSAIRIRSDNSKTISHIVIDGFIARGQGEYAAISVTSQDAISVEKMTNNIVIRNSGAFGSANLTNKVTFGIARVRDSLFEDLWSYGFGRKSILLYGSIRVTIRRVVARYDYWDGSGYKPNDPRMGFAAYNSHDGTYENIIVMDNAPDPSGRRSASKAGFALEGNVSSTTILHGANRNRLLGSISLNNDRAGLYSSGHRGVTSNNNNQVEHFVSWNNQFGIIWHAYSYDDQIKSTTLGRNRGTGISVNNNNVQNTELINVVAYENDSYPYFFSGQEGGLNGVNISLVDSSASGNGRGNDIEAEFMPTFVYLLQPEMKVAKERGAVILNRYKNGALTSELLWPWRNEALIKEHMCNASDLATVNRIAANGPGWEPEWCVSGKTLSTHILEYLGTPLP